jgi:hypothetical protein
MKPFLVFKTKIFYYTFYNTLLAYFNAIVVVLQTVVLGLVSVLPFLRGECVNEGVEHSPRPRV